MTARYTADVPLSVLDGGEGMMRVTFDYRPGKDACGPSHDHGGLPAEPPEIEITESRYLNDDGEPIMCAALGLAEHEEERAIEWLLENWEPPTGPDPDDERDRRRDEALTERD